MEWPIKKLADVCDLQNGFAFKSKDYTDNSNTLNIRMSNIRPNGSFNPDHNPRFLPDSYIKEYPSFLLQEGDLVIAMTDMAGEPKILGLPTLIGNLNGRSFLMNQRVGKLFDFSDDIHIPYLRYYLSSPIIKEYYKSKGAGGLQINISKKDVLSADIPLPPISEQKRIVALLDTVFSDLEQARAKTEQNLKNARELFESICSTSIFSVDSIPSYTVLDVAKSEKGAMRTGPFGSQLLKREIVDSGIAVLGIDNAVKNSFQWGAKRFITPEKFEELSRFEVKPGDVLITIMGTCGRCAIVPENIPKAINTKHICCITLDQNKCIPEYLHAYFLYHPIAKEYLMSRAKGAIMAGLNMGIIKELPLVLPNIEEQKRLVSQVILQKENIDNLEMTYKSKLAAINELKKSILQKAFSGELTTATK